MEFQSLVLTIVNAAMIMSLVLLLREKVARNKRAEADDQEIVMDLSDWDKARIPFFKRNSKKASMIALAVIGVFLIWIGVKNIQALFESLVMGLIAGGFVIYMRKVDDKKDIGVYTKGILHKTGFVYYNSMSGFKTSESDEYYNAFDVWITIGNTPRVVVHVPKEDIKDFEKLLRKNAKINN